jgi:tetratricopeptide (TPR) repeat protein
VDQSFAAGTTLQNRYRIESELGHGGMGVVYRGHDTLLDRPVALKVLSKTGRLGSAGQSRLLREAQAVAKLNHPNIVSIYDAGEQDESPYIVMELVEGQSLRADQTRSIDQAIEIAKQVCAALDHAHTHNIIHRDLKPENIIITHSQTAKLMDFGLARTSDAPHLTEEGLIVGTFNYLAPELIMGQPASPQSDLYALGVMLYELVANRPPFVGDNLTAVISQHLYAPVVPPSTYNAAIPPRLDALIVRLLSKGPEDRFASAAEVQHALESLRSDNQSSGTIAAQALLEERPLLDRIVRGRLVGRQTEGQQLRELWRRAQQGHGHLALISGEPGVGKTRLANETIVVAQLGGAVILRGGCYEYEAATPYLPFAEALRAWADPQSSDDLRNLLGSTAYELAKLVPEIETKIGPIPPNSALPANEERLRLFDHIARFLQKISVERGLLLFIDDLHWADHGSIALLHYLMRRLRTERVLVLACYREVELDRAHPLANALVEWNRERMGTRIPIGRLTLDETRAMIAAVLGLDSISDEFAQLVHRETEGNPFFVEEVIKSLIEQGQIYREGDTWERKTLGEMAVPQSVKEAIGRRLNRLNAACIEVLHTAAALGKVFEFAELAIAGTIDEDKLLDALDEASSAQLIRSDRGDAFAFTHDKIREVLYEELNPVRRRRLHQRIGEGLEKMYAADLAAHVQDLAHHFTESGDLKQGLHFSIRAAEKSAKVFALDEALTYYEHAVECCESMNLKDRLAEIYEAIGAVYYQRGPYNLAVEYYQRAIDLTHSPEKRAGLKAEMGTVYAYVADERGIEVLKQAQQELNPHTQTNALARATAMLGRFHHYRGELREAIELLDRARELAEPLDNAVILAEIYAYLSGAYQQYLLIPELDQSMDWARRTIALGERKDYLVSQAIGYEFLAEDSFILGNWRDCIDFANRDREIGEKIGAASRVGWAEASRAHGYHGLGELANALTAAQAACAIAERLSDTRLMIFARTRMAMIKTDLGFDQSAQEDIDFTAARAAELNQRQTGIWVYLARAYQHTQLQNWSELLHLYEDAVARNGFALLGQAIQAHLGLEHIDEASRLLQTANPPPSGVPLPTQAVQARVRGQVLAANGATAEALANFNQAIAIFEQQASQIELGRALVQRGLLLKQQGKLIEARSDFARARSIFEACGAVHDQTKVAQAEG